jgi:catechol 2,3-dioxygenase-like lactoylglutathione lyase family enzyme
MILGLFRKILWQTCRRVRHLPEGAFARRELREILTREATHSEKEFLMRRFVLSAVFVCFVFGALGDAAVAQTFPYDHVHLNVPDPAAAANWYEKYFGGRRITEAPDRLMYGSTRLLFIKKADAKPSAGSAIDHVSFSVADLDAKMKEFEAAGVKIVTPARDVPGLFKAAFVEDPWGTRIEVVQDPDMLGLHHVHMRAADPEMVFTWLLAKFGGQRAKLKGRIDGIKYSAPGFSDVWILVQKGEAEPSEGHAIDHIGWRSPGPLAKTIDALRAQGVTVLSEPSPLVLPSGFALNFSYVAGPAGAKIELVERPGLKPGE